MVLSIEKKGSWRLFWRNSAELQQESAVLPNRAAIEKPADTNGKKQITPYAMFHTHQEQGATGMKTISKEPAAKYCQKRSNPVTIEKMKQTKTQSIKED